MLGFRVPDADMDKQDLLSVRTNTRRSSNLVSREVGVLGTQDCSNVMCDSLAEWSERGRKHNLMEMRITLSLLCAR